jgi:predicted dithiol-disulfide oxidoreductase (DUF899 family)
MKVLKKRKRGANFSPFEKSTLLNLVHKYKNIVSNNKTDAVAVEEKEKCWKRITEEFNFESPNGILPLIRGFKIEFFSRLKKLFEDFSLT